MRVCLFLCALAGAARADVSITVTTSPVPAPNNQFSPRNVVAAWVEGPGGAIVKTIDRHSDIRTSYLVAWLAKAGPTDVDAVTGATRQNHTTPLTMTWDLRDRLGTLVPDGTYTLRLELAESNATQPAQNNQGRFTFVKSATPERKTGLANGRFTNATIDFQPVFDRCNNGVVDPGELCDPGVANSCPTSCPAPADACMPSRLLGTAAACSARCAVQPITACTPGDGCCPDGCEAEDTDCTTPDADLSGGCTTGGGGLVTAAWAALLLASRGRSRRSSRGSA